MTIRTFKDHHPTFGKRVYIDAMATVIGDVALGNDVSIWPMAVLRGDVESIKIGDCTNVQDGAVLHVTHYGKFTSQGYPLSIGNGVTVGHRVVAHACTIGNYCLLGIGSIIMDDAVLEDYVMIGAGSLVPPGKKLEGGYLYVGSPVKQMRLLSESEKEFLEYSARHYVHLKDSYLNDLAKTTK